MDASVKPRRQAAKPATSFVSDKPGPSAKRGKRRASTKAKSSRLEVRISPDGLAMIRRAAEIQGRTISDFVSAAAQADAKKTIEDTHIIRLSLRDQRALIEAILNPPKPNAALKRAFEAHRRLVVESR
jgi:uncharacterized protein (DUF1778 family)